MKKKWIAVILVLALLTAGLLLMPVRMDYGASEVYSQAERERAARMIREQVEGWEGCRLISVAYAGDSRCQKELPYCQRLADEGNCSQCMVFEVLFRSPIRRSGAWEPNQIYSWSWYLGKTTEGTWEMLTWGAA